MWQAQRTSVFEFFVVDVTFSLYRASRQRLRHLARSPETNLCVFHGTALRCFETCFNVSKHVLLCACGAACGRASAFAVARATAC